jgi:hypothetical protein
MGHFERGNLTMNVFAGTQSFYEVLYRGETRKGSMRLLDKKYADKGKQLPENVYAQGLSKADAFAEEHQEYEVLYVRGDLESVAGVTDRNRPTKGGR